MRASSTTTAESSSSAIMTTGSAQTDREALLECNRAMGGEPWTRREGWADNADDLGSWGGVALDGEGRVAELQWNTERPAGDLRMLERVNCCCLIPPEIGRLDALKSLSLNGNKLKGSIPRELGQLAGLEHLDLSRNQLDGCIPPELGNLAALVILALGSNKLTGSIPPEMGKLLALEKLSLYKNELAGSIPPELGRLVALEVLALAFNGLSGSIPPEMGRLVALKIFSLPHNELTGSIPPELGGMLAMEMLALSNNELSGSIPPELGQMVRLKSVVLDTNKLTGSIPPELGRLIALKTLSLSYNELVGSVPSGICGLSGVLTLDLRHNKLTDLGDAGRALSLVQRLNVQPTLLMLDGNPWIMPPEAVVEKGLSAVEMYLSDVLTAEGEVKTMKLLKVVLVGSSQAGKTSLMNSIVHGEGRPTEGTPEDVSTVGIELLRYRLRGVSVEFYDCAGQMDYAGMHQTFLSRRALYLLVWDVKKCHGKNGKDLDQVIKDDVMSWLYALHLRAPNSTVMFVANKCDGSMDVFSKTVETVVKRTKELLEDWQCSRGIRGQPADRVTTLNLLPAAAKVSCRDGLGLSQLIDKVADQGSTSISVPPAWGLALAVVGTLRDKQPPLNVARKHLNLPRGSRDCCIDRSVSNLFIPKQALARQWDTVLRRLSESGELRSTAEKAVFSNPDSALEGSLWISEFSGQILRVDGGDGVFLDVELLSQVLNPILSHKLRDQIFTQPQLNTSKHVLLKTGVLRWNLARELWRDIFRNLAPKSSVRRLERALFDVLVKLGVGLPLVERDTMPGNCAGICTSIGAGTGLATGAGTRAGTGADTGAGIGAASGAGNGAGTGTATRAPSTGSAWPASREEEGGQRDMLLWRWLPPRLAKLEQDMLDTLVEKKRRDGAREVSFKWEFDLAGPPQGLVGLLIASCHVVGEAEKGLCWRSGSVFQSPRLAGGADRLYLIKVFYDSEKRLLSVDMFFGPLDDERVWAALRFVASVMVNVSKEWPGVLWAGWLECATHVMDRVQLETPSKAKIGSPLIATTRGGCDCLLDKGGVLGQTCARLGNVIDTNTGDPFQGCRDPEEEEEEEVVAIEPQSGVEEPVSSWFTYCGDAFEAWQPYAWATATKLAALAFALFLAIIALEEAPVTMWHVCVVLVGLMSVGAGAAACVAGRLRREEPQTNDEQEAGPLLGGNGY